MIFNDLRKNITDVINQSGLPIDGVYYIMKDIMNEIIEVYNTEMEKEAAAAQESESEVKADEAAVAATNIEEKEEKE